MHVSAWHEPVDLETRGRGEGMCMVVVQQLTYTATQVRPIADSQSMATFQQLRTTRRVLLSREYQGPEQGPKGREQGPKSAEANQGSLQGPSESSRPRYAQYMRP